MTSAPVPAPGSTPNPGTALPSSSSALTPNPLPPTPTSKPTIVYDDFAKLDLRVATVISAEAHPNADRLLKLQVDLGTEVRQVCAGVKVYYPDPSVLVGKQVVVVVNLAPRTIRGEISNGMILAASAATGDQVTDVVLLALPKPMPNGSKVRDRKSVV
jgi:tRNA-binding protein